MFTNFVLHTPRILLVCLSVCPSKELDNQPAISVHQSIICSCNPSAWVPNKLLIKNNSVLVYELLETNLYSLEPSPCVDNVTTAYDFQHITKQTCRCSGTWVGMANTWHAQFTCTLLCLWQALLIDPSCWTWSESTPRHSLPTNWSKCVTLNLHAVLVFGEWKRKRQR